MDDAAFDAWDPAQTATWARVTWPSRPTIAAVIEAEHLSGARLAQMDYLEVRRVFPLTARTKVVLAVEAAVASGVVWADVVRLQAPQAPQAASANGDEGVEPEPKLELEPEPEPGQDEGVEPEPKLEPEPEPEHDVGARSKARSGLRPRRIKKQRQERQEQDQQLQQEQQLQHEQQGTLLVRMGSGKKAKYVRRWMVLKDCVLQAFDTRKTAIPSQLMVLAGASVRATPSGFRITTSSGSRLSFRTPDRSTISAWVSAIRTQVARAPRKDRVLEASTSLGTAGPSSDP